MATASRMVGEAVVPLPDPEVDDAAAGFSTAAVVALSGKSTQATRYTAGRPADRDATLAVMP